MNKSSFADAFKNIWANLPVDGNKPASILYLAGMGLFIGLLVGAVISFFRITTDAAYTFVINWSAQPDKPAWSHAIWFGCALLAAIATGFMVRNPAIRFGGEGWVRDALRKGQRNAWLRILLPKFIGSWLVMACGISVGREGPCIQMGAATALGCKRFDAQKNLERRYFILGGCAAGLAAAFSAPFAGICYVYEIMREKISRLLLIFMLAGSFGVFVSCSLIFDLNVMMPFKVQPMGNFYHLLLILPLALLSSLTGILYNYLLRSSMALYNELRFFPPCVRPVAAFLAASLMILYFPAITGEGLTIFPAMQSGQALLGYLFLFLMAKLLFTAFCYGSSIPAGIMVPVLCLGGVAGGIYYDLLEPLSLIGPEYWANFVIIGMCGAFAAAERAPVTAFVLVLEMTAGYAAVPGMFLASAIGSFCGRMAKVRSV